jgi:glucose-1-phosphate cytidylyltransferase
LKVVLFCGGLGMRIYPLTHNTPKPLVHIGAEPIIVEIMKYYAYFGHNDFILCLGYKANAFKEFFSEYKPNGWKITFVDTGLTANIGTRLKAVERCLDGEKKFLANYSDAVTNLHLPTVIDFFERSNKIACLLSVGANSSYHQIISNDSGLVSSIVPLTKSNIRVNGGYFIFKKEIFDYIGEKEELVEQPFQRLVIINELLAYKFDGYWANMDTYKDKQVLDELALGGKAPWQIWL